MTKTYTRIVFKASSPELAKRWPFEVLDVDVLNLNQLFGLTDLALVERFPCSKAPAASLQLTSLDGVDPSVAKRFPKPMMLPLEAAFAGWDDPGALAFSEAVARYSTCLNLSYLFGVGADVAKKYPKPAPWERA